MQRLASALPRRKMTVHNQGNIQLSLSNMGSMGWTTWYWSTKIKDPFSQERVACVIYPRGSDIHFQMNSTLLLGAVVGWDTLVSTGVWSFATGSSPLEFYPVQGAAGDFSYGSIDVNHSRFDSEANSQLDIACEYVDTFRVPSAGDLRRHIPLGVKIKQKSRAWTGDNIDDFVLFEFEIQNIGGKHLREMYIGFIADGGVNYQGDFDHTVSLTDDVVGFLPTYPTGDDCELVDTIDIAYQMDADGDPVGNTWAYYSPRAAVGTRIISIPSDNWRVNFNWVTSWRTTYGPRLRPAPGQPYRTDLPQTMSVFMKDVHMYYLLSNPEVDYDQIYVTRNHEARGWIAPPPGSLDLVTKTRPKYLISAGPFELLPGDIKSVAMAIVGGEKVHVNPSDFTLYRSGFYPNRYYESLDFSHLADNARWAGWIYDNPGVDTDNDGYRGEFRICNDDTTWYKGDGVPDYLADGPPLSPKLRVIPSQGRLIIRWNGFYSETARDPFTGFVDFEGYRVYVGLDGRKSSLSLLNAFDRQNFDRFRWAVLPDGTFRWINEGIPFSLDTLRWMYRNPEFRPEAHPRLNPMRVEDTLYYFAPHSYNAFSLCCMDNIHKVYPNAADPGPDPELWTEDDVTHDYGQPLPKFYEYEYVYDNLLPTLPYWIAVTAFDFGFAGGNIPSKESSPLGNLITELAQTPVDTVDKYDLDVYVYPNPWRWDGHYAKSGYENRDGTGIRARSHRIHFSNLPGVCKISVYSLDGDLIREWEHNYPDGGPGSMHDSWDMITRNAQAIESGLYYWVVESEQRTQIGKIVILK